MNALSTGIALLITAVALWGVADALEPHGHPAPHEADARSPGEDHADLQLRGRVFDARGNPVAGVTVVVRPHADLVRVGAEVSGFDTVLTDASGSFVLEALLPGDYQVLALHCDHPPGLARVVLANLAFGAPAAVRIVLDSTDLLILT